MILRRVFFPLLLTMIAAIQVYAQTPWRDRLAHALPMLGRHNWIVVADPAYPLPTSAGIEVVATDLGQKDLLTAVLDALGKARNVRPVFYTETELPFVAEQDAVGISAYRTQLTALLQGGEVYSATHDQLAAKLEALSNTYHVLVLKSTTTLPYISVFIQLDSGYWSADAEKRLRAAMAPK